MSNLNPNYFNPRGFKYPIIYQNIIKIIEDMSKDWVIDRNDLTAIFIYGDNIEGNFNNYLIINLYFENIISSETYFKRFIRELEDRLLKDRRIANLNLELKSDIDPKSLPQYFDLKKNRMILNRDYKKYISKPKPKILIETEEEPITSIQKEEIQTLKPRTTEKRSITPRQKPSPSRTRTRTRRTPSEDEDEDSLIDPPFEDANIFHIIQNEGKRIRAYTVENIEKAKEIINKRFNVAD